MRIQSDAEYRRARAAVTHAAKWHREAEVWFDGSIESVDRRLAMCNRSLAGARAAVAEHGFSTRRLAAVDDLTASQGALEHLRRQLLTAAGDRDAALSESDPGRLHKQRMADWVANGVSFDGPGSVTTSNKLSTLQASDRRWVELEAAKLVRANPDVDTDELVIRAQHHAQRCTGILPPKRARAITAAFVGQVEHVRKSTPRVIQGSVGYTVPDCPAEMMFM